ncbi:MAG: hypothetical protein U9N55_01725 [candidate division Zixibacteria bacterium]|nr:hypothetical protein [candidate division Zixibacteria bacterium]
MAKKQSFADKSNKRKFAKICPVCDEEIHFIKHVKAVKSENGWKYRSSNVGVCKCNEKEIYG